MDKNTAKSLGDIVLQAMQTALSKKGYKVRIEGGKFDSACFYPKVVIEAEGHDAEKAAFDRDCGFFDLKPQDYGREFIHFGVRYKLTGVHLSRPRYPFSVTRVSDGKRLKVTQGYIADLKKQK